MHTSIPSAEGEIAHISAKVFADRLDEILDLVSKTGISMMIECAGRSCLLTPCHQPTATGDSEER